MNKKILVIAVALMAVAMLATPVLAIGPFEAVGSNPNLELEGNVCDIEMGVGTESSNRWFDSSYVGTNAYLGRDFTQYRAAVKEDGDGEIKGADVVLTYFGPNKNSPANWGGYSRWFFGLIILGDTGAGGTGTSASVFAAEYENKWIYMSSDYIYLFLQRFGSSESEAYEFAYVKWEYGVYYRYLDIKTG